MSGSVRAVEIELIQTSTGAGTVIYSRPFSGEILEVRMPAAGTVIATGTADFTITRVYDGSTVLNVSNVEAPWEYFPRRSPHSTSGGTTAFATGIAAYDTGGGVPINGELRVVWAQGTTVAGTASLWVHVREM